MPEAFFQNFHPKYIRHESFIMFILHKMGGRCPIIFDPKNGLRVVFHSCKPTLSRLFPWSPESACETLVALKGRSGLPPLLASCEFDPKSTGCFQWHSWCMSGSWESEFLDSLDLFLVDNWIESIIESNNHGWVETGQHVSTCPILVSRKI